MSIAKEIGMEDYSKAFEVINKFAGDKSRDKNRSDDLFENLYDYWENEKVVKKFVALKKVYRKQEEWFCKKAEYSRVKIIAVYDYDERNKLYEEAHKQAKEYLTYSKEFLPDGKGSAKITMYNEPALINLLNHITDLTIAFQQEYTNRGGKGTPDTPRFIQGLIGATCWLMLDVATSISISVDGVPRERFNTQAFVMKYIHLLSLKRNHEIFKKEGRILQDKWGMSIQSMYSKTNIYAPTVPYNYAGHKDGVLGFIVRKMINGLEYKDECKYNRYYDVFGGSGRALLQIPLEESKEYYINDLNPCNCILWLCLKDDNLYKEFITKLNAVQKEFLDKHADIRKYMEENELHKTILKKKLNTVEDKKILAYHEWLHDQYNFYYGVYKKYSGENIKTIAETDYIDIAVAFVVVHNFLINGRPADNLTGGINLFKIVEAGILKWNFDRDFKGMRSVYQHKNVKIQNDKDINIIKNVPNTSDIILQIDTPYIATKGYDAGDYSLDMLEDFMDNLFSSNNERRFIFHCQAVYRSSATPSERKTFIEFLQYMKDKGKDCYVTFAVSKKNVDLDGLGDEDYKQKLVDKFYNMVVNGKNAGYGEDEYIEDEYIKDSSEIIYTNFEVGDIKKENNYQEMHNPYRVAKAGKKGGDYIVITRKAQDFLKTMIDVLKKTNYME